MHDQVLILSIDGIEKRIAIENLPVTIGRYEENRIVLPYDYVSGEHGKVYFKDGEFLYEDLDSTNGTYMGKIGGDLQLIRNECIPLGSSGRLVFGREDGAEIVYRIETVLPPGETEPQGLFQKGYTCLKQDDFPTALSCFEQILDRYPQAPLAYYYAAFAASKCDRLDDAILRFEQYLTLRPRDTRTMIDLGRIYERKGDLDKAGTRYRKALELNPNDNETPNRLKNLKRFEPVSMPFQKPKTTVEVLGTHLIETVTTQHFVVTYNIARHGRMLNDILKTLEESYETVGDHLDIYPSTQVSVTLCVESDSAEDDKNSTKRPGTYSDRSIRVVLSPETIFEAPFLRVVLIHEYMHFVIDSVIPEGVHVPWWLHEGIAQYESQNLTLNFEALMAEMAVCDSFIPIQILEKGIQDIESKELSQLAYAQAYSMVDYLFDKYGRDTIKIVMRDLSRGTPVAEACKKIGIEYDTLEADWRVWLESRLKRGQKGKTRRVT
ncbi:MAG: tetratricopeptide repeat protein [Pseudomonadota bacterium]